MIKFTPSTHPEEIAVYWALTKYCDKTCHYCAASEFVKTTKKNKNLLECSDEKIELDDHIAELLPELVTNGHIMFFGGEPTLHPKCIDYFNELCRVTKDNPNVTMYLITHGDVAEERIRSINTHGKHEVAISISYHYYQVDFEAWFEKVKIFNGLFNVIVSALTPRRPAVWEQFEKNIRIIMASGIPVELKPEFDYSTNDFDPISVNHFKELKLEAEKTRTPFLESYHQEVIHVTDGTRTETLTRIKDIGNIPVIPLKTVCSNKMFIILNDVLQFSCGEGRKLKLTKDIPSREVKEFINKNSIICTRNTCQENRTSPATITVAGATLEDKRFRDFVDSWKKQYD